MLRLAWLQIVIHCCHPVQKQKEITENNHKNKMSNKRNRKVNYNEKLNYWVLLDNFKEMVLSIRGENILLQESEPKEH